MIEIDRREVEAGSIPTNVKSKRETLAVAMAITAVTKVDGFGGGGPDKPRNNWGQNKWGDPTDDAHCGCGR